MKRILNFRPLFYCFIAFLTAILFAPYIFKTNWVYISIFIFLIFGLLILSIIRKKIKIYLLILLFVTIGLTSYCIEASTYNVKSYGQENLIVGRVASEGQTDALQKIVLDKVSINGEEIKENVYIYIYGAPYLHVGDIVTFNKKLNNIEAFYEDGTFANFYYKNNIRYKASVSGSTVEIIGSEKTLSDTVRLAVKEKLWQNMSAENAAIAYASLLGDQSDIDLQTRDDYRASGITHILSISGLHVSILVGFLFWLLNKLRSPKTLSFVLILSVLILYCYLCGFVPSVVRASIMSICLLGAGIIGRKYDSLSAIGLAGIIILLIVPLTAFDIGFQLSFGSIIGIAMFYRPLKSALRKVKTPNFLAASIAVSTSAQFFIMPVLVNAFGGASIFSVLINILVIPMFSLAYITIFICTPFLFLSGFFGNILWLPSLLFESINICANFVASLKWSIIPKIELSLAAIMLFYIGVFISSRFVFLKAKHKAVLNTVLAFATIILISLPI